MRQIKNILLFLLSSNIIIGDTDSDVAVTGSGTIPFCASWTTSTSAPDFATVNIDAYDADYLEFATIISVSDFDANYAFNISASKGGWTLPASYDTSNGAKKTDGSDSDFLIKVDDITAGYSNASEGLVVANSHDSYQALTTGGTVIASGGSTSSGSAHGVENAAFNIDGKVLLDWDTDIPGTYSLTITITVATQ
jgi:hypothetical protein